MALTVTFTGRTDLPTPVPSAAYKIWSYRIQATGAGELPVGRRIALGLPGDVEVLSPSLYPNVPQLAGTFVERDLSLTRQYVGRVIAATGPQTVSFVAYESETTREVFLVRAEPGQPWTSLPYTIGEVGGTPNHVQVLAAPAAGPPVSNGRPVTDFVGTLPYASEVFGVYQPLAGWFGALNTMRAAVGIPGYDFSRLDRQTFSGDAARTLSDEALAALAERFEAAAQGVLSPVGVANLFRQYFFEFDTFLGPPAGHLWISPGGTVEVVETSTRRTLVEKVAEQAEETSRKIEESLTEQDDVADAVKEDNANETKLGVSVTGGASTPVYHADASLSFSTQNTVKRSSEETHKHSRTQSAKVTSEIKRNYKTTFKTVTETTDTSSRRYLVQNTTLELVNYELRRKMRKVGVQLQHIGTRLSWQLYFPDPGRALGLGDLVDVVPAPDRTAIKKPEKLPEPADKQVPFHGDVQFILTHGADDEAENTYMPRPDHGPDVGVFEPLAGETNLIKFKFDYTLPPPPAGYKLRSLPNPPGGIAQPPDFHGAQVQYTTTAADLGTNPDPATNRFSLRLTHANFQGRKSLPFDAVFTYEATEETKQAIKDQNAAAQAAYEEEVAQLQREAYGNAVRNRLKLVSSMRPRPPEDLRSEERQTVYGNVIQRLLKLFVFEDEDPYLGSELIRQIFDVDEMLYFVAPDFWRPSTIGEPPTQDSVGRYPVPAPPWEAADQSTPLAGETVAGWYSYTDSYKHSDPPDPLADEWRVNYLITEQTLPAPLGSSLGWLIQIDGDERRNQFLNAAWAKAVLPVRPGHELDALKWITKVEGQGALGLPYPVQPNDPQEFKDPNPDGTKKTVGQVLQLVADALQKSNTEVDAQGRPTNLLATEKVFETGFDPLEGGFRPAAPYQVFDQWIEVLPTDQIATLQVSYDPKTGLQL